MSFYLRAENQIGESYCSIFPQLCGVREVLKSCAMPLIYRCYMIASCEVINFFPRFCNFRVIPQFNEFDVKAIAIPFCF